MCFPPCFGISRSWYSCAAFLSVVPEEHLILAMPGEQVSICQFRMLNSRGCK